MNEPTNYLTASPAGVRLATPCHADVLIKIANDLQPRGNAHLLE